MHKKSCRKSITVACRDSKDMCNVTPACMCILKTPSVLPLREPCDLLHSEFEAVANCIPKIA